MESRLRLLAVLTTVIVAAAITSMVTNLASIIVQGQVTIQPEPTSTMLEDEAIIKNLSISFENGSKVMLNDISISQDRCDYLVGIINVILGGAEEDELPTFSQVELEDILAAAAAEEAELEAKLEVDESEIDQEESSSDDSNDNGNNDNGNDDNGDSDELEEPILPIQPIPRPGPGDEEEAEEDDELALKMEVITRGCAEGLGYHKDGPYKCYPLDSIGEEPPEGVAFCAALSCPWNPPDLSKSED